MSFLDDLFSLGTAPAGANLSPGQQQAINLNKSATNVDSFGQVLGGVSHIQFGQQAQQSEQFQADQLRQNAGQAQASAQRQAFDVDRESQYTASAALASAAASGGGASDPTVVNLIARNAGEFAYRKAVALYQGDDRARLMNLQADAKEYQGKATALNSNMVGAAQMFGAGTTVMKGSARQASLYQRFAAGGPDTSKYDIGGNQ